jgi:hypothetical protein
VNEIPGADCQLPMSDDSPSRVRMIGLWKMASNGPESLLGFPHPASLVAHDWETERRGRIVDYLRGGHTMAAYAGYSFCRFEDCSHIKRTTLGTRDLTDGQWAWPEGLWHYVADHNVRLPDAFVADAASHGFVVPAAATGELTPVDVGFWIRWVAENTAPPIAQSEACSLEEAQAICAELSTTRWRASVVREHERWKLRRESEGHAFEDFTGAVSGYSLRAYLFRFRLSDPKAVLALLSQSKASNR